MAEVCRNRTDRPDKIRTAGFEVPDGHQPACTSVLEFALGCGSPARPIVAGLARAMVSRPSLPPSTSNLESAATRIASGHSLQSLAEWIIEPGAVQWAVAQEKFPLSPATCLQFPALFGAWRSLVARLPWAQEVPGSNPGAPTNLREAFWGAGASDGRTSRKPCGFYLASRTSRRVGIQAHRVAPSPVTDKETEPLKEESLSCTAWGYNPEWLGAS
jgi:hypothetical protein